MDGKLLSGREVAELLGVKTQTLALWRIQGRGPRYSKIGALVRYAPASVDAWIASRERASTTATTSR